MAVETRGRNCERCQNKPDMPDTFYDWHHRKGTVKDFHLSGGCWTYKWDRIENELSKCDLLCPDCHRLTHLEERNELEDSNR